MAVNNSATESLLNDEEKKRQLFWSLVWLILAICVVLPLTSFLAPLWLFLQLLEAFLPVGTCERCMMGLILPYFSFLLYYSFCSPRVEYFFGTVSSTLLRTPHHTSCLCKQLIFV